MLPVVLTRPAAQSERWAAEMRTQGIRTVVLPLLEIAAPHDLGPVQECWSQLQRYAAVFFVSSNAVTHFFAAKPADAQAESAFLATNTRAWAPGPGSAAALREAGVAPPCIDQPAADAVQFDSESLWRAVQPQVRPGQQVLIVRGLGADGRLAGRDWLAQQLQQAGVLVDQVGAYQRRAPRWQPAQLAQAEVALQQGAWWLFSSAEAVANLARLLPQGLQTELANANAIATHPRVAHAARAAGFSVVHESQPTLLAVLASIRSRE
ncbi:MAG: uroporphyrinogen-III synthase [Burkholderiaceae bacterium]